MGEKKEALRREKRRKEPDSEARRDSVTVTCRTRNLKARTEPDESLKRGKGRLREKRGKEPEGRREKRSRKGEEKKEEIERPPPPRTLSPGRCPSGRRLRPFLLCRRRLLSRRDPSRIARTTSGSPARPPPPPPPPPGPDESQWKESEEELGGAGGLIIFFVN